MNVYGAGFPISRINFGNKPNESEEITSVFAECVSAAKAGRTSRVEEYTAYLKKKYGNFRAEYVTKDPETLERLGKKMRGDDVIIAPNIVEEMALDNEKAAYFEGKIDYFFDTVIPRETARCNAMGLVFEPCGVVVHEDGSVTYICGCSDSPERVAKVNAINKAKRERKAEFMELQSDIALRRAVSELSAISGGGDTRYLPDGVDWFLLNTGFLDGGDLL